MSVSHWRTSRQWHPPRPSRPDRGIMEYNVILEPSDEGGYTAIVPALPGCISEGDTVHAALQNIREAIELYLESVNGEDHARS